METRAAVLVAISALSSLAAQPVITSVQNAAWPTAGLAPGTMAVILGTQLAPSVGSADTVPLPLTLAGVSVTVGTASAPLSYVSPTEIVALVPFEATVAASVPVVVTTPAGASPAFAVGLAPLAPALFTENSQGTGPAVVFDVNYQPVTNLGTAPILLFATGLGPLDPPPANSAAGGASAAPFNLVAGALQVYIGEQPCMVSFAGLAPGTPAIYELRVVPPVAPLSNRVYLTVNGVQSNFATLPIPAGVNVANVTGSIDGIYPASGIYAQFIGAAAPIAVSEMLTAAAVKVSFDIVPNAKPFTVTAIAPGATATLQFDPASGTWKGQIPTPWEAARQYNFSGYNVLVYNLQTQTPFPGGIVPLALLDPHALTALGFLYLPNLLPDSSAPSPNGTFVFASRPLVQAGHFSAGIDTPGEMGAFFSPASRPAPTRFISLERVLSRSSSRPPSALRISPSISCSRSPPSKPCSRSRAHGPVLRTPIQIIARCATASRRKASASRISC